MPIYEYTCPKCGHFEVIQKITDKPLVAKPECDCADCPRAAMREISASAFHLKGSGWYKTDYTSSGSAGTASKPAKKTESSSGGSGTKSDSKSETKPPSCGSGCGCH